MGLIRTGRRQAALGGLAVVAIGWLVASAVDRHQHLYVVEEVVDGDTLRISWHGHDQLVQLAGIDAPELHKGLSGEPGADIARDYLRSRVLHRTVWLEALDAGAPRDRKGRLLSWVWLDDDNICYEMVSAGLARFSGTAEAPHRDMLVALQDSARTCRRGVWATRDVRPAGGRARPDNVELQIKERQERSSYGYRPQ